MLNTRGGVSKTVEKETAEILHKLLDRSLEERIRQRAYELYVQRGRQSGRADLDWREAEKNCWPIADAKT